VILGTKTAAILIRVIMQASADIFIMDWEKPMQQFMADGRSSKSGPPGTIAWRSILVANEINEL